MAALNPAARGSDVGLALKIADADVAAGSFQIHVVTRRHGHDEVGLIVAPVEPSRSRLQPAAYRHVVLLLIECQFEPAVRDARPLRHIDRHSAAAAVDSNVADVRVNRECASWRDVERPVCWRFDRISRGCNHEERDERDSAASHGYLLRERKYAPLRKRLDSRRHGH